MKEYREIPHFRQYARQFVKYCRDNGIPLPTKTFTGTVKIDGSNIGVRITPSKAIPQTRTHLMADDDGYGFVPFFKEHGDEIANIIRKSLKSDKEITIYGEWCGQGIQKGMAVCKLPKHWVLFDIWDHKSGEYIGIDHLGSKLTLEDFMRLNALGVYFVTQIPKYSITVDFNDLKSAHIKLASLVEEVENECPWGKYMGVSGYGEGIVWKNENGRMFKTKGDKSLIRSIHKKPTADYSEKYKDIIPVVLPDWRLEQGLTVLIEDHKDIDVENLGSYLKWISSDILKEENEFLEENNVNWKELCKVVNKIAKQFFMDQEA